MIIRKEQLEIPDNNPFENDIFKREFIADNLEKIISSASGNLVVSNFGAWHLSYFEV